MSLIVHKYGGTSLASLDHVRRVAERIAKTREEGHDVVVVASAMGKTTTELLDQAQALTPEPPPRELDMLLSAGERISMSLLAIALGEYGLESISLTGPQAGIHTDATHFNARITGVAPSRVREELERGRIVVVAGYQGVTPSEEIATLGRGGSDTTAVALAAALDAERCEIWSDVDGVYTADPRIVADATRIDNLAYEDMLALARHGARVLNARAVAYARRTGTTVRTGSTFGDGRGTLVHDYVRNDGNAIGIASHKGLLRIEWDAAPERETLARTLDLLEVREPFHYCASPTHAGLHHEMMIPNTEIPEPEGCGERLRKHLDESVELSNSLGSVSVVGTGLDRHPETRRRFTFRLSQFDETHAHWLDVPDALSCTLPEAALADAARALHEEFIANPCSTAAA